MRMQILSICCASLLSVCGLWAQQIKSDTHSCRYVMSDVETVRQAEVNAVKQAQLEMIANNFGTIVGATTALSIAETATSITYGDVDVKGVWLSDNAAPVIRKSVVNDHFVLDVTVSGKIMEIVSTPIDLKCSVLKNGTDARHASTEFIDGDRMCLSFKTPVDGYLAIYIGDRENITCLFPYNGLPAEAMAVKAGEEHVFFSKEKSGSLDPFSVKECSLGCSPGSVQEMVRVYVVFSPNKFTKANDSADGRWRSLPFADFHAWLSRNRRIDQEMNLWASDIVITRK